MTSTIQVLLKIALDFWFLKLAVSRYPLALYILLTQNLRNRILDILSCQGMEEEVFILEISSLNGGECGCADM